MVKRYQLPEGNPADQDFVRDEIFGLRFCEFVRELDGANAGMHLAWTKLRSGDFVMIICTDRTERLWRLIETYEILTGLSDAEYKSIEEETGFAFEERIFAARICHASREGMPQLARFEIPLSAPGDLPSRPIKEEPSPGVTSNDAVGRSKGPFWRSARKLVMLELIENGPPKKGDGFQSNLAKRIQLASIDANNIDVDQVIVPIKTSQRWTKDFLKEFLSDPVRIHAEFSTTLMQVSFEPHNDK